MRDDGPTEQDLEAAWLVWQAIQPDASFSFKERQQGLGHPFAGVAFLFARWLDAWPEKPTTTWKGITPISDVDHKTRLKIMELFSHAMDHRSRREIHA